MENMNLLWPSVLSSVVASAVITSIVQYFIARYNKSVDYKNEYYKTVLNRRIDAYSHIETFIINLKTSVAEDPGPYHLIFDDSIEHFYKSHEGLMLARLNGIWLSPALNDLLSSYNKLYYQLACEVGTAQDLKAIGRKYYEQIADARTSIEKQLLRDMVTLHEVHEFLKQKQRESDGYIQYSIPRKKPANQPEK